MYSIFCDFFLAWSCQLWYILVLIHPQIHPRVARPIGWNYTQLLVAGAIIPTSCQHLQISQLKHAKTVSTVKNDLLFFHSFLFFFLSLSLFHSLSLKFWHTGYATNWGLHSKSWSKSQGSPTLGSLTWTETELQHLRTELDWNQMEPTPGCRLITT